MNMKNEYQPKTGQPCHCKRGQQRDNCPDCEGTGMRIDFKAIREQVNQTQDTSGLISALEFYANPENWKEQETGIGMAPSDAETDYGNRALTALNKFQGGAR